MTDKSDFLHSARRTVRMEAESVSILEDRLDESFVDCCKLLMKTKGRVIVTGMGKSGHIANKMAATFASTGTPAFYVHPGEASHGDMGMITDKDCVVALSNSGSTPELLTLLPLIKRLGIPLIALTGNEQSTLAKAADAHLDSGVETEACPLDLAPTSSTTCTLVLGDALAIALLEARGFTAEDFAFSHPGGALGRKLLLKVDDVMRTGSAIPCVARQTPLGDALLEVTRQGLGMTTITESGTKADTVIGVFTDGDLRRALDDQVDIRTTQIGAVMTKSPSHIKSGTLAAEALRLMQENRISALLVLNEEQKLSGVVTLLGLLEAGIA
ncbi:MAG: KpsF/GutQ family sugar-phosphate isomerase [Pseudomonadota bacterium]